MSQHIKAIGLSKLNVLSNRGCNVELSDTPTFLKALHQIDLQLSGNLTKVAINSLGHTLREINNILQECINIGPRRKWEIFSAPPSRVEITNLRAKHTNVSVSAIRHARRDNRVTVHTPTRRPTRRPTQHEHVSPHVRRDGPRHVHNVSPFRIKVIWLV